MGVWSNNVLDAVTARCGAVRLSPSVNQKVSKARIKTNENTRATGNRGRENRTTDVTFGNAHVDTGQPDAADGWSRNDDDEGNGT